MMVIVVIVLVVGCILYEMLTVIEGELHRGKRRLLCLRVVLLRWLLLPCSGAYSAVEYIEITEINMHHIQ